jgi:D-threo-aldose 1-dehydrogenase
MSLLPGRYVTIGTTGIQSAPVVFCAASLGNVKRVITEQAKTGICTEWLRQVRPVLIHVAYEFGDGIALEVLGRTLRRLEIPAHEIAIELSIERESDIRESWEKSCWLLGTEYRPKLLTVSDPTEAGWRKAIDLKKTNAIQGVGFAVEDWQTATVRLRSIDPDWVTLSGGCTVMRHSLERLALITELMVRQIPVIVAGVFEGGFLVGGSRLDGLPVSAENETQRGLLAWRKAFVALCDGHGIVPAHSCIQFALSVPGVVAVQLDSSHLDRVAANIRSGFVDVPANFWMSMIEEGLLERDIPGIG